MIGFSGGVDARPGLDLMKQLHADVVPKATARGINETAKAAQTEIRAHLSDNLKLRREAWAKRSIKIPRFATPARPQVAVRLETPGDAERTDILGQHELGDDKVPKGERLAVADPLSKTSAGIVPAKKRPKALGLVQVGKGPTATVFAGPKGVFMIKRTDTTGRAGAGGVYLRRGQGKRRKTGKGKGERAMAVYIDTRRGYDANVVRLFRFIRKGELKPGLGFIKHGMSAVERTMVENFMQAFDRAIAQKGKPA